jgi:hypothetical protein
MRYPSRREVVARSPDQPRESVRAGWSPSVVIDWGSHRTTPVSVTWDSLSCHEEITNEH